MNKSLLIVCYFFPPCPSIGGRRSAKFAKYLAEMGNKIFVIQAKNPFNQTSTWLKDIEYNNIVRNELPLNYPIEFIIPPKTIYGKIKYRLFNFFFNLFYPRKNKFDYSIFWEKAYLAKAEELIKKHKIKNILISGPPFYYAHQTIKLKDVFPDLNIIIDFRDPWIGSPYYGMSSLNSKQQKYEVQLINEVYKKANYFIAPNSYLLKEQLSYIDQSVKGAKILEVPHGYDKEELAPYMNLVSDRKNKKIKLVYGGQIYPGTEEILKLLDKTLSAIKVKNVELYNKLEFEFYTPETDQEKYFLDHNEIVNFYKPVGNEIMAKISRANICLIFLAEHNKDFRTTKFIEYSVLRKPFLVFGPKGYVSHFVEENMIGKSFDQNDMKELVYFLINIEDYLLESYNSKYDFSEYDYRNIIDKLITSMK
jgi:hypothetical protein